MFSKYAAAPILDLVSQTQQNIAKRLIYGADLTRTAWDFYDLQRRLVQQERNRRGLKQEDSFSPSVWLRLRFASMEVAATAGQVLERFRASRHLWEDLTAPKVDLAKEQAPGIATILCSDSRIDADRALGTKIGENFVLRNVGASLESPSNPQKMSADAQAFIRYVMHLGATDLVIMTHGQCGCMVNALHWHERTPDGSIFDHMARRKQHIVTKVDPEIVSEYMDMIEGGCLPQDERQARLLSFELAHGLHSLDLANDFLKQEDPTSTMRIHLVHLDLRDIGQPSSPWLWVPEREKFVNLMASPDQLAASRPPSPRRCDAVNAETLAA